MASLVDRVAARREAARSADPVTMEEFGYLLGNRNGSAVKTRTGVTITEDRALGITSWYSGVRYLAETLASLPFHTYRETPEGRVKRADPPWLARPDVEMPRFGLVEFLMMSLLHRGNAYAWKIRDPNNGRVLGLRALHPKRVRTGQASDGTKMHEIDNTVPATRREVLHIPGLSQDGVLGLSPIKAHAESLGIIAATDEAAGRFYGESTHPSGVISVPQGLNEDAANKLRDEWTRFHQGLRNRQQVGVLSKGATYTPISLSAEDAALIESRQFGVAEVSRILRIPPHKLYDLSRATFSNIEHQSIEAVMDGIRPWAERIEAWVNFDRDLVPEGNLQEFQLDGLLRGDFKTRMEGYGLGVQGGFLMPSEPRKLERWPHIEGSDYLNRPLNMGQIGPDAPAAQPAPPMEVPA